MLTRHQVTEQQAAILAACPRPRALAPSAITVLSASASFRSASAAASVAAVSAGFGSAAVVRPVAGERPEAGLGQWQREMVGSGIGAKAPFGIEAVAGATAHNPQDPQDTYYLTSRRELRTWRPPH